MLQVIRNSWWWWKVTDKWSDNDTIGKDDVTISNITVSGTIIAKQDVADIIGKAYNEGNVTITNRINNAKIEQTNSESGRASGILTYASGQISLTILICKNSGVIKSHDYISSILNVGFNGSKSVDILVNDCLNSGNLYVEREQWNSGGNANILISLGGSDWETAAKGSNINFSKVNVNTNKLYLGLDESSFSEAQNVKLINLIFCDSGDNKEYNGLIETKE